MTRSATFLAILDAKLAHRRARLELALMAMAGGIWAVVLVRLARLLEVLAA